jgi:hypothetical protein
MYNEIETAPRVNMMPRRPILDLRGRKDHANPWNPGYGPKTRPMEPMPNPHAPRWLGNWHPRSVIQSKTLGAMADATSSDPESYAPAPAASPAPSAWAGLWSGLASIIAPAATAYAGIKTTATLTQAQQRAQAQTWNPSITGPAIQAQAWQNAYQSGTGITPTMSMGTMALVGAGILAVILITRKK